MAQPSESIEQKLMEFLGESIEQSADESGLPDGERVDFNFDWSEDGLNATVTATVTSDNSHGRGMRVRSGKVQVLAFQISMLPTPEQPEGA